MPQVSDRKGKSPLPALPAGTRRRRQLSLEQSNNATDTPSDQFINTLADLFNLNPDYRL